MKLTNNRFYFDFNASSPWSSSVKSWLAQGDLPFGNPSSIHSDGKSAQRLIRDTTSFLKEHFQLSQHHVVYHSGATEGINAFFKGLAMERLQRGEKLHFCFFRTDHACIVNQREDLEALGHQVSMLEVNANGELDLPSALAALAELEGELVLNFTWVNNETGVVWPLELAKVIKAQTNAIIHVDAVQAVGKVASYQQLSSDIDAYTFSGHKFGAMKGVGFSFIKERPEIHPLIRGGGQQKGHRSGTENIHGIFSLKLALTDLTETFDFLCLNQAKESILAKIKEAFGKKIIFPTEKAQHQNGNTIYVVVPGQKADVLLTAFDLAGMSVSSGSACSSGAIVPSRILLAMGFSDDQARSAIRFSFSSTLRLKEADLFAEKIVALLGRFIS